VSTTSKQPARQRVPAAERRDALIAAAIEEFALGGLHGTPVDRIARRVGVAQPYVFSLFPTKRDLFIAAVERGFELTSELFSDTAAEFRREHAGVADTQTEMLREFGVRYTELLFSNRPMLMLQLQAYAACDDEVIRERVRAAYERLVAKVQELTGIDEDHLNEFLSIGMWLNVQAAIRGGDLVEDLCDWIKRLHPPEPPAG
jgi:AcrR family transcriptional regulator